jgi:hypothetical protein
MDLISGWIDISFIEQGAPGCIFLKQLVIN